MVLGYAERQKLVCQYSLKVELWHSERMDMPECQKSHFNKMWHSDIRENEKRLCLSCFPSNHRNRPKVQGSKNTANRQVANIQSIKREENFHANETKCKTL